VWINFPTVLYGILSLIAALLVLMLPETLNKPLPQTTEDTEQMGLTWYVYSTNKTNLQIKFFLRSILCEIFSSSLIILFVYF
jgi:hypothetical protein